MLRKPVLFLKIFLSWKFLNKSHIFPPVPGSKNAGIITHIFKVFWSILWIRKFWDVCSVSGSQSWLIELHSGFWPLSLSWDWWEEYFPCFHMFFFVLLTLGSLVNVFFYWSCAPDVSMRRCRVERLNYNFQTPTKACRHHHTLSQGEGKEPALLASQWVFKNVLLESFVTHPEVVWCDELSWNCPHPCYTLFLATHHPSESFGTPRFSLIIQ